MTESTGTSLDALLIQQVQALLDPLLKAAENPVHRAALLAELGWDLSALAGTTPAEFEAWLDSLSTAIAGLADLVADDGPRGLEDLHRLLTTTRSSVEAVTSLPPALRNGTAVVPPPELLAQDLLTHLTVTRLRGAAPVAYHLGVLLGLVVPADQASVSAPYPVTGRPVRQPIQRPALCPDRIGELLRDPGAYLIALHAPKGISDSATADEVADRVLGRLALLLSALGLEVAYGVDPAARAGLGEAGPLAAHMLRVTAAIEAGSTSGHAGLSVALSPPDRGGLGVVLVPHGEATVDGVLARWRAALSLAGGGVAVALGRHGAIVSGADGEVSLGASLTYLPDETGAVVVLGGRQGTRLELGAVGLEVHGRFGPTPDHGVLMTIADAAFVLATGEGDGFLKKVLPEEVRVPFALGLGWSRLRGLYVENGDDGGDSEGFAGTIPVGLSLGPLKVPSVYVAIKPDGEKVVLVAAASADVALGPVAASIERAGLTLELSFPPQGGNAGPADLAVRFQPPAGVGLAIKGGLVTGSGYLFADPDAGEYGGAVQLQIGSVGVSAVGLLTTRMPDGSDGFSLLVLISVRFPPIQLGLGFAITAIGGLVGVNRTVAVEEVRKGLQTGSLDTILFPPDLAANARRVVSDLGRYFPPVEGQYVFGPTAEIVWGTPPLVTIQIGLLLELPSPLRVILAGKLRMTLPTPEAPVLDLKLDLLGSLDLTAKKLAIDAVLRDSRVAAFTLTGQAAVRLSWGDTPGLLLAAGGFHPRFAPPSDFPALSRLTLALGSSDNPRLRLAAYFALTSNTAQVGARLDLYAGVDIPVIGTFSVSAILGFDALFQFEPFAFVVDITAQIALEWDGDPFLAVRLDMALSGPKPWHAVGKASFECFGRHELAFDVTVGKALPPRSLPSEDVEELVVKALALPGSWSAVPPGDGAAVASLREGADRIDGAIVVHPLGSLTVSQKLAPLDTELARFGQATIRGARRLTIDKVTLGGTAVATGTLRDQFAPAQYLQMTDAQKLQAPSFQKLPSGVSFDTVPVTLPTQMLATSVAFDDKIVDPGTGPEPAASTLQRKTPMTAQGLLDQVGGSAAAQFGPAALAAALSAEPAVTVVEPQFAVAQPGMTVTGGETAHLSTYVEAEELRRSAGGRGLLVVETSEIMAGVRS